MKYIRTNGVYSPQFWLEQPENHRDQHGLIMIGLFGAVFMIAAFYILTSQI